MDSISEVKIIVKNALNYTKQILEKIIDIPSPSGYCRNVLDYIASEVKALGFSYDMTAKGNGLIYIPKNDSNNNKEKGILLSAHVDTLGAMVRSIKADGKIRMTTIGGFMMQSVEGEYCTIHMRNQKTVTGTILSTKPSVHVYNDARSIERTEELMEIRLDASVTSKEDVQALGITVGDYISFDPRYSVSESGYIKSRHLDDKAGVAILMGFLHYIYENQVSLSRDVTVMFSTYEEVGHGSSYIPTTIDTLLAIDMGAIGDDLTCTEKDVSICVKDGRGPYDYGMVNELINIAQTEKISYALDIYPYYSSDASAALTGGHDIKAALIGPGVHASHTLERTHEDALRNTLQLLIGYLK